MRAYKNSIVSMITIWVIYLSITLIGIISILVEQTLAGVFSCLLYLFICLVAIYLAITNRF